MSNTQDFLAAIRGEVAKAVAGNVDVIDTLIVALLVRGHVLLEGVPGVAKTLMVKGVARSLDLDFSRIQLAPDLMPSDITGNIVYEAATGQFRYRRGPIFTNVLLADEINRTPPKTQAALLEGMEERQVTVEGDRHALPDPFMVIATQNPVEFEGTYPLPEAQLDRFLFKLTVGYPSRDDERIVLRMHDAGRDPHDLASLGVQPVADRAAIADAAREVTAVTVADEAVDYILDLAAETRRAPSLVLGASPRAAAMLLLGAKGRAYLEGRSFVTPDDIKALLKPAWRHRVVLRPEVELEGATTDSVLESVVDRVAVRR